MQINPETLKTLREKQRFSQQDLADHAAKIKCPVGKSTILRIETGRTLPKDVRRHTLECLAKALDVKPEVLCKPVNKISDEEWQDRGFTPIKFLIPEAVRQDFRWVHHHYGLEPYTLVNAAPWMAALLAEMSLAERKRRLKDAENSFQVAMERLPEHLKHGSDARIDFENAVSNENDSLACRDIFGREVLDRASSSFASEPFDPDVTNPFVEFLRQAAINIDQNVLDLDDLQIRSGSMPAWPLFQGWLHDLTGGDRWARFAVENVEGVLDRMKPTLKGEDKTAERVQWLTDEIPAEMRAREEERVAELRAKIENGEFTL